MNISELQKKVHENAVNKDFYDNIMWLKGSFEEGEIDEARYKKLMQSLVNDKLMHVHSEVDEAYKAHRSGDMYQVGLELADIALMALSVAGVLEIDLGQCMIEKMEKNIARPVLHGNEF